MGLDGKGCYKMGWDGSGGGRMGYIRAGVRHGCGEQQV